MTVEALYRSVGRLSVIVDDEQIQEALQGWRDEFDMSQADREARFNLFIGDALKSIGYDYVGGYIEGFTLTSYNQILRDENGEFWRAKWQAELPYTTVGVTASVDPLLSLVGDNYLRQELQDGKVHSAGFTDTRSDFKGIVSAQGVHITMPEIKPVIVFIDDDGHGSFLTKIKPVFDEKNVRCGSAICSTYPENAVGYMSWDEVRQIQADGYEILSHQRAKGGHAQSGLANLTKEEKIIEIAQSRAELEAQGLTVESLVYTSGAFGGAETLDIVARHYRSAFVTMQGGIQPKPLQDFTIHRMDFVAQLDANNPTLDALKSYVDTVKANNEIGVFAMHAHYAGFTADRIQVLRDLIDYIKSQGIDIMAPRDALDIHGSKFLAMKGGGDRYTENPYGSYVKIDKYGQVHFGDGATGSFVSSDGKAITVKNGIISSIS